MSNTYTGKNPDSTFPAPKFIKVFDKPGKKNAVLFFRYWASIPADKHDLIEVKLYRTWPQVDLKLTEPNRKDITWDIIEGKIPFDPPEDYQNFFLEKYFSGEWNVILNEKGVKGKIMEAFFDATDMEKYPPRVDLRTVLWDKTANRSYQRWCEQKRIQIPGQEGIEFQEAQEMTAGMSVVGEAMKTVVDQNTRLTESLIDAKEAKSETEESKSRSGDNMALEALKSYVTMVDAGAKAGMEILKQQGLGDAKQYDPMDMMTKAFDFAAKVQPQGNGNNLEMVKMVIDLSKDQHNQTMAYLRERDERQARETVAMVPQKGGIDLLIEEAPKLQALKDLFGWGNRRGDHEAASVPPTEPKSLWLEKLVEKPENLQAVMGIFALASNMVAMVFGKGKPTEEVVKEVTTAIQPNQPAQPPVEERKEPTTAEKNQMFCEFIEAPFLEHFFDPKTRGLSGSTFAKAFLGMVQIPDGVQWSEGPETPVGRQQYELVKSTGIKAFDHLLRGYSPIWGQVSAYAVQRSDSKEPPKYFQFLQEFFSYDQRRAS